MGAFCKKRRTSSMIVAVRVLPLYVMAMGRKQLGPGYPLPYICSRRCEMSVFTQSAGNTHGAVQRDDLGMEINHCGDS